MNIKKIIIHNIIKEVHNMEAIVEISENLLEVNDKAIQLTKELNKRYTTQRQTKILYARFDETSSSIFPKEFNNYIKKPEEKSFKEFTINTTNNLKDLISTISAAKGGYLVFIEYEDNYQEFLGVYLIRNVKGMSFKKISGTNTFEINISEHVDFEKLAMACRIDLSKYKSDEQRYLSFIDLKKEDVSQYFNDWISSKDKEDNLSDTKTLYSILNKISCPQKFNNTETFLEDVYSFIKSNPNNEVNLRTLSCYYYDDENHLIEHINDNKIIINSEFQANTSILRRFKKINITAEEIYLSFPKKLYKDKIKINGNKIIIESKLLAEKIISELSNDA